MYAASPQPPPKEGEKTTQQDVLRPGYMTADVPVYELMKQASSVLKSKQTKAESILWRLLKNKNTGYKIRRQHIIAIFIVDFVCLDKKVVIEVDGEIHDNQKERDNDRTQKLNILGYSVIRFTNEEVYIEPVLVVQKIVEYLDNKK